MKVLAAVCLLCATSGFAVTTGSYTSADTRVQPDTSIELREDSRGLLVRGSTVDTASAALNLSIDSLRVGGPATVRVEASIVLPGPPQSGTFTGGPGSWVRLNLQSAVTNFVIEADANDEGCFSNSDGRFCPTSHVKGQVPVTVSGQIRLYDPAGRCVWCADVQGSATITFRSALKSAALCCTASTGTFTLTETLVSEDAGLKFTPLAPCRVVDTRSANGPLGGPSLPAKATRDFSLQNVCGIPSGAGAVAVNITAIPKGPLGFLTAWKKGITQPTVSTLNSLDGRIKANFAILAVDTTQSISLYATDSTDVALDVTGYFAFQPPSGSTLPFQGFSTLAPCRVVDTRLPNGALAGPALPAKAARSFPVLSANCNIPSNATAYSLNITVIPRTTLGFLTLWASGKTQPLASTLNATTGTVVANAAILEAGSGGMLDAYATDETHLLIDINGYFSPSSTALYYPSSGCRIAYTGLPNGPFGGPKMAAQETRGYTPDAGACNIAPSPLAYALNVTVVPDAAFGFLTLWPSGTAQPVVSTLNAVDGAIASNAAIVATGTNTGRFNVFTSESTHLILDLLGYFK
jgi:hypothetical protein